MTRIVRHRYEPSSGTGEAAVCSVELPDGKGSCREPLAAVTHYQDGDHPYVPGVGAGVGLCGWRLQYSEGECGNFKLSEAHHLAAEEAQAAGEAGVFRLRPPDEAAEARTLGTIGAWAASATQSLRVVEVRPGTRLLRGEEVAEGPWPVRQWVARGGGLPEDWEEPGELICALNVLGAAFEMYVWWRGSVRLVRVVWGELLGLDEGAMAAAMDRYGD